MQPTVGRIVHYVSHGTPKRADGTQAFTSQCRAAVVTEVDDTEQGRVIGRIGLVALNPTGMFFHSLADGGCVADSGEERPGEPDCPNAGAHGRPYRYCSCGWVEASYVGGTWHWPERRMEG
jgi:hypothetical protein